jgi:hypothetical protein
MFVDSSTITRNGKQYTRHLLRTSYREDGKVKHRTIANISDCSAAEIAALKLALKHKDNLGALGSLADVALSSGRRVGAVWCLKVLTERLGVAAALGRERQGRLALWQVCARLLDQGSRLSAVRLAQSHAACEALGLGSFDEDDLYQNLSWLSEQQEAVEQRLFRRRFPDRAPGLFLYDVTSSYLEGECNELAAYGYNRDGKKGKKQIVVGLLTDAQGDPAAVRVFEGNTPDSQTVSEQVRTLTESFGVREVTLVGDRGMLKGPQLAALPEGFRYLTALTKPQIRKLLAAGVLQLGLFDARVAEVSVDQERLILRRNPRRAEELAATRADKRARVTELVEQQNAYLAERSRATVAAAQRRVQAKIAQLKVGGWLSVQAEGRVLLLAVDEAALADEALLDGCYVLRSDVPAAAADKETLHDRYKDLAQVERAFRTMKTAHLELRPVYLRKEKRTKGHALVVMLAYLVRRELERCWANLDLTVEEGLDELGALCSQTVTFGAARCQSIPTPGDRAKMLLAAAQVELPLALPHRPATVATKKKLPAERKK